ncbi:MAG: histidine phosphatase family protein [Micromonosporaceae bacterium]
MRLIFVRHAESEANARGSMDCTVPGPPLSPHGFTQADALPDTVAPLLDGLPLQAVWASTMTRAQQTAAPLAHRYDVPLQVHPLLHEVNVGDLNERVDDEAHQAFYDVVACWHVDGDMERACPNGETGSALVARLRTSVDDVLATAGDEPGAVVVVSHGAILMTGLPWLCDNLTSQYVVTHHLANTSTVVVDVVDREAPKLVCRTWDDTTPA